MTALTILTGPLCGALSIRLAYRSARLLVSSPVAAFTALLFAFTSPLFPYSTSAAHYSHVYLTCTVSALTYVSLRTVVAGPRPRDWLWVGGAIAIAVLHRLPAALYAAIPLAALPALVRDRRPPWRLATATSIGAVVGVALTSALYKHLYGNWFAIPQGPYYVHLSHAHPWLLLFGVHGGFFFWMPAAWLVVPGLVLALRRARLRLFALGCVGTAVAELLVSSAPLDWHGNWSLGARRLLPLLPFVIVFSSLAVERSCAHARRYLSPRFLRPAAVLVVVVTLVNNVPASTTIRGDRELSQRELYGALSPLRPLWSALDAAGLDVALLPAELYFGLRYGLPARSYRIRHHASLSSPLSEPRVHGRRARSTRSFDGRHDLRRALVPSRGGALRRRRPPRLHRRVAVRDTRTPARIERSGRNGHRGERQRARRAYADRHRQGASRRGAHLDRARAPSEDVRLGHQRLDPPSGRRERRRLCDRHRGLRAAHPLRPARGATPGHHAGTKHARRRREPTGHALTLERRQDLAAVLTLLAATLAYALVVVQYFGGPLIGVDDANGMEHYSFLLDRQLTLGLPPRIAFAPTKEVLYPFGTLVVLLPWGVERDLVYTLFHGRFGEGPWLQLYQAASVAVSSIGTYFLLRREEGAARALAVSFVGTFMNFYAVYKFPHHMNVATLHWAAASESSSTSCCSGGSFAASGGAPGSCSRASSCSCSSPQSGWTSDTSRATPCSRSR